MGNRILTFRVSLASYAGFDPAVDRVSVRGSFNNQADHYLEDKAGDGFYTASLAVDGSQGDAITYNYVVWKGLVATVDELPATAALSSRSYILGPVDTPASVSALAEIYGTLTTIVPQNVKTGGRTFVIPLKPQGFSVLVWDSLVAWDGNAAVTSRGLIYDVVPLPLDVMPASAKIVPAGGGNGDFFAEISGLPPGSILHFRAFATNASGTSYGAQEVVSIPGDFWDTNASHDLNVEAVEETSDNLSKVVSVRWQPVGSVPVGETWEVYKITRSGHTRVFSGAPNIAQAGAVINNIFEPTFYYIHDAAARPGEAYSYYVGYRASGKASYFSKATITTTGWQGLPAPVLSAHNVAAYSGEIRWSAIPGAAYYEVRKDGEVLAKTKRLSFFASRLSPVGIYTFEVVAINGGGESAAGKIVVQTTSRPSKPATSDRVRILKKTQVPLADSLTSPQVLSSVIGSEMMAPGLFAKKDNLQHVSKKIVFGDGFWGAEDLSSADWLVDGVSANLLDQGESFTLKTESAQESKIRPERAGFVAAYDGEYIDGDRRKTIANFSFFTPDPRPRRWVTEGCLQPGVHLNCSVMFYTQKNGDVISGGAKLYCKFFKKILDYEVDAVWDGAASMTPILGVDGSPYAVKAAFPISEEERFAFMVDIPANMEKTQTVLVVVAES